jgi:hypothetical protein
MTAQRQRATWRRARHGAAAALSGASLIVLSCAAFGPAENETAPDAQPVVPSGDGGDVDVDGAAVTVPEHDAEIVPDAAIPARGLEIHYPVATNAFVGQCTGAGETQDVWQVLALGRAASSRLAAYQYAQTSEVHLTCKNDGARDDSGAYPIVVTRAAASELPAGVEIAKCVGAGAAEIFVVVGLVQAHPAARYARSEPYPGCP